MALDRSYSPVTNIQPVIAGDCDPSALSRVWKGLIWGSYSDSIVFVNLGKESCSTLGKPVFKVLRFLPGKYIECDHRLHIHCFHTAFQIQILVSSSNNYKQYKIIIFDTGIPRRNLAHVIRERCEWTQKIFGHKLTDDLGDVPSSNYFQNSIYVQLKM